MTAAERARVLAGIAELQGVIRDRLREVHHDTDDGCTERQNRYEARINPARAKVGDSRMNQKTRFSHAAPDLGQDIIGVYATCTMGCLLDDGTIDPGDKDGRESIARSCTQATVALEDLAAQVKGAP